MISLAITIPDTGFYLLALLLLVSGLGAIIYAWFGDRHRRQPICRRCYYNMAGHATLTCPECGYEHQKESELFKPRRHPRLAAIGLLLLLFASVSIYGPTVQFRWDRLQESWLIAWIPTTAMIATWSYGHAYWMDGSLIERRVKTDAPPIGTIWNYEIRIWPWQAELLRYQIEQQLKDKTLGKKQKEQLFTLYRYLDKKLDSPTQGLIDLAKNDQSLIGREAAVIITQQYTFSLQKNSEKDDLINEIWLTRFQHGDDQSKVEAIQSFNVGQGTQQIKIAETIAPYLPKQSPHLYPNEVTELEQAACEALIRFGPRVMPVLIEALADDQTRGGAIYVIDQLAPDNAEAAAVLVRQYTLYDDLFIGPFIAHHAQVIGRMGEAATPAMTEALLDADPWVRLAAMEAIREIYLADNDFFWDEHPLKRPNPRSEEARAALNGLWALADQETDPYLKDRVTNIAEALTTARQTFE